jgi:hypothetical protein
MTPRRVRIAVLVLAAYLTLAAILDGNEGMAWVGWTALILAVLYVGVRVMDRIDQRASDSIEGWVPVVVPEHVDPANVIRLDDRRSA